MPTATAQLLLSDAVPLAQAWVQHVADAHDIRVIAIKGIGLHHHALRPQRVSSDLDVLVDPRAFDAFDAAITAAGWRTRPASFASARFTEHSRTYVHPDWPCDLDVHAYFPGFLAEPQTVFDELWARSELIDVAARRCRIPDRTSSIAVLALHSLRSSDRLSRHREELDHLVAVVAPDEGERTDLRALALATGCVDTLDRLWETLDVRFAPHEHDTHPDALRAWRARVDSGSWGTYFWLTALRDADWRERAVLVRHALWPDRADILLDHPGLGSRRRDLAVARWQRLGRGLSSAPAAVRALVRHRSPFTRSPFTPPPFTRPR